MTRVRVRGIYATALTRRFLDAGHEIVDASPPIVRRFEDDARSSTGDDDPSVRPGGAPAASVETTQDRQGVQCSGDPEAVETVCHALVDVAIDAMAWPDPAPLGAVCNGVVADTRGGGAVVDLPGGATGYLPFDDADGYVDVGDRLRVQVTDPSPPWDDFDGRLSTDVGVERSLVRLERGGSGVRADAGTEDATALARRTNLLDADAPDGWGVRWQRGAVDAGHQALEAELERATATAAEIDDALADAPSPSDAAPRPIATPAATTHVWFGRESRFALDEDRRRVTATLPGHHRIKAADESASLGVDLAEAITDSGGEDSTTGDASGSATSSADAFPFDAVASTLGPQEGDDLSIDHGKPDGRLYSLGRGEVTAYDPDGAVTLRREMSSSGTYDALGTQREPGDVAITKLREGRWWYPTVYRGTDGEVKGKYVNVCTPVEVFPDAVRYVDLHVDVIQPLDGDVEIVDEDELAAAVEAGHVGEALAETATSVAERVRSGLAGD